MALNTHDVRKTGTNRRYNIGAADSTVSFMFLIGWTLAKVVKVQITKDFKLTSYKVSNIRGVYTILEVKQISVKAGQVLYFTRSGMDKMYYLTSESGCTCRAGRYKQPCHHVEDVTAFVESRKPVTVEVTSEVTSTQIEVQGMLIPAHVTLYRVGGQGVYYDAFLQGWFCTCGHFNAGCEHIACVGHMIDAEKQAA